MNFQHGKNEDNAPPYHLPFQHKKVKRKRVRFSLFPPPIVQIRSSPTSPDEKRAAWYSEADFTHFRELAKIDTEGKNKSGCGVVSSCSSSLIQGMDISSNSKRQNDAVITVRTVLKYYRRLTSAHDLQHEDLCRKIELRSLDASLFLAKISSKCSRSARLEAERRGHEDFIEASAILTKNFFGDKKDTILTSKNASRQKSLIMAPSTTRKRKNSDSDCF